MKKSLFELVRFRSWMIALVLIPVLSSCLKSTDPTPTTPVSYVSFYHGSPDSGGLDIYLGSTQINSTAFAYGNYSGYASFSIGANQFRFTPTGSSTALEDVTYTLVNGRLYSLFIVNTLANLETVIVQDTAAALSSTGKAGIRVVNLSPDSPLLHLDAKSTSTANKVISSQSLYFKGATLFTEIDSDIYDFDIKNEDGTVLASATKLTISSGQFYTLVIKGFVSPPSGNTNTLALQQLVNQ